MCYCDFKEKNMNSNKYNIHLLLFRLAEVLRHLLDKTFSTFNTWN